MRPILTLEDYFRAPCEARGEMDRWLEEASKRPSRDSSDTPPMHERAKANRDWMEAEDA